VEIKKDPKLLSREKSTLLIIDVQEKLLPVIRNKGRLLENILKLIKGCNILNVPIYYTEQYPKGLGETSPLLKKELESSAIQKMSFSCARAGNLFNELIQNNITQIIVCGTESHVCVQQTVLDLLENGFQVDVAADAVSSKKKFDYKTALKRMQINGAEITTTESILFELLNICGTDEFKAVSRILK